MVDVSRASDELFETGPFPNFQRALSLFRPVGVNVGTRAIVCIAIGWFPLVLLVLLQSGGNFSFLYAFFTDFAVHARSLLAAPLFIICELLCLQALEKIARHYRVAHGRASLDHVEMTLLGLVVFVLLLVAGPLIVFVLNLHSQKVVGTFRYGFLAQRVGRDFEQKWLENYEEHSSEALQATDFSATTDLYGIVSNIQGMGHFPFEVRALVALIVVTLLPFIPVALMAIPFKVILKEAASLLF